MLLQLDGLSRVPCHCTVPSSSFYIQGAYAWSEVSVTDQSQRPEFELSVSTLGSDRVDCNGSYHSDCVFFASNIELRMTVADFQMGSANLLCFARCSRTVPAQSIRSRYPRSDFKLSATIASPTSAMYVEFGFGHRQEIFWSIVIYNAAPLY